MIPVRPLPRGAVGIGWRPALADLLADLAAGPVHPLRFSEVIAENVAQAVPSAVADLVAAGVSVVAHGIGLGLAGADRPDPGRLAALARTAQRLDCPLVSEHVAFVRSASGPGERADLLEAGHLVPGPRTRDALAVLVENVRIAQDGLPVPLALENPSSTLAWPESDIDEPEFLTELVERTGCLLLLDVANIYATSRVLGGDPHALLARMPLEQVGYVHIAGGAVQHGFYLDTHAHDIPPPVLDLLADLLERRGDDPPPVLIERDDRLDPAVLVAERAAVLAVVEGSRR